MTKVPVALAWEMAKGQLAGLHDDALEALESVFRRADTLQVEVPCTDCGADIIVSSALTALEDGIFRLVEEPRCDTCKAHHEGTCGADCPIITHKKTADLPAPTDAEVTETCLWLADKISDFEDPERGYPKRLAVIVGILMFFMEQRRRDKKKIEEQEALFQKTHGVHISWVAKVDEVQTLLKALDAAAAPLVEIIDFGDGVSNIRVNGFGICSFPTPLERDLPPQHTPREYAEEVARVLRLALAKLVTDTRNDEAEMCARIAFRQGDDTTHEKIRERIAGRTPQPGSTT